MQNNNVSKMFFNVTLIKIVNNQVVINKNKQFLNNKPQLYSNVSAPNDLYFPYWTPMIIYMLHFEEIKIFCSCTSRF